MREGSKEDPPRKIITKPENRGPFKAQTIEHQDPPSGFYHLRQRNVSEGFPNLSDTDFETLDRNVCRISDAFQISNRIKNRNLLKEK